MSEDNRPPLQNILDAWHDECSEWRKSERGTPYQIIPKYSMPESLHILVKTLLEKGYSIKEMDSSRVSIALIDTCWKQDVILKIPKSDIIKEKMNLSKQWHALLHTSKYSGIKIAKLDESEKIVTVEKPITPAIVKEQKVELPPTEEEMQEMANLASKLKQGSKLKPSDDELDVDFLELIGVKCKDTNEQ